MKNYFTIQKAFSFLIILALIINVSISNISSSSTFSFLIKISSSILLCLIFYIHLRLSKFSLNSMFASKAIQRMLLIITIIILYFGITLFYSSNPAYGAQKIINIIICIVPNILVSFYLITYRQKEPYGNYLFIITTIGFILTLLAVLIIRPFDQSTIYQFAPQRWSHVFIGRIISFLSLIVFLYTLSLKKTNKIFTYSLVFTIGLYITYLTGLRSALIGLMLCSVISFGWQLYKKNLNLNHIYSFIAILILIFTLILITPQEFSTPKRISNMLKIENLDFGGDAPILTRVESYKLSWQMFTENLWIGGGIGSFNGYNNIEWTLLQKYPHNIILEILCELGLVGLILFLWLCYLIIKRMLSAQSLMFNGQLEIKSQKSEVKKNYTSSAITGFANISSHFFLITFFFCLFLAMFSKDISTQGFLWLFVVFVGGSASSNVKRQM